MTKRENLSLGMKALIEYIHKDNIERHEAGRNKDMCYCVHYSKHGIYVWQRDSRWMANPERMFKVADAYGLDIIIVNTRYNQEDRLALLITD